MDIYLLAVLSLIVGLGFAWLATWLTTRKGNTIKDVLEADKLKDAEAIRLEIIDQVKISTNIPVVALYIVATIVAIGPIALLLIIPLLQTYEDDSLTLAGQIASYDSAKKIYVTYEKAGITSGGAFTLPITATKKTEMITFESQHINPMTLRITLQEPYTLQIVRTHSDAFGEDPETIAIKGRVATLNRPIKVRWAKSSGHPHPPNEPTEPPDTPTNIKKDPFALR